MKDPFAHQLLVEIENRLAELKQEIDSNDHTRGRIYELVLMANKIKIHLTPPDLT